MSNVSLFEVGPRDGLQNEKKTVSLENKILFINRLVKAGVSNAEIGAFVRPDKVPQMADTEELFQAARTGKLQLGHARAYALVANDKGLDRAIQQGVSHIAIFTAASETFNEKNIGRSISQSLREFKEIIRRAKQNKIKVRGYVSTVFGCPYEGKVSPKKSLHVIDTLSQLGVEQVSIGDTIGVASPQQVKALFSAAIKNCGKLRLAGHFHDTRGTALANVWMSYELGIRTFDSSAGGLGGCPYAPGATGNVATEDLIYLFHSQKIKTGLNLHYVCKAAQEMLHVVGREPQGRVLRAYLAQAKGTDSSEKSLKNFFKYF